MRIVQVTRQFSPAMGGLEEAVLSLARELRNRHGIESDILTLDRVFSEPDRLLPQHEMVEGLRVTRIPFSGSRRYPLAPRVIAAVATADLVHVHGLDFFFDALAWTKPYHRKPLVASTHGGFFHTQFAKRLKSLYFHTATALSCRAYYKLFATSENDAALFRQIAEAKVVVTENGVDTGKWSDRASPVPKRSMIYFGRLSANKRIDLWFPVLRELLRDSPHWTLIVAGRADDVSFDSLENAARHHGVLDAVTFASSPSADELGHLIGRSSYYVSASEHEGFGISAVEAMSAGLLPILSRIPAFERFLQSAPGLIVEPQDGVGTASAVRQLHERTEAAGPEMRRALRTAAQAYDWAPVSDTVAATYREILGSSSTHRSS